MTTPHRTLQMALDALDAITDDVDGTGLNTMPSFDKALDAIAALREALNAPEPEPVAEVYRARYGRRARNVGVDDVRKLNGVALPPLGTKLYAAPPAAPAPAQPVPLTQDQIADCTRTAHRACDAKGPMTRWSTEFARAIEAAHGITGGSNAT